MAIVRTVTGDVEAGQLGQTSMHEHIFGDFTVWQEDPRQTASLAGVAVDPGAGIIGEIGTSTFTGREQKVLRACAGAHLATGAAISPHTHVGCPTGEQSVQLLVVRSWLSYSGAGSGLSASPPGHHIHRPRSRLSAVTSTDRTTIVSSRMPKATAKPSSVRNVDGIVARTANVPASTKPAEVITPPVAASPTIAPCRASRRFASSRTRVIKKML